MAALTGGKMEDTKECEKNTQEPNTRGNEEKSTVGNASAKKKKFAKFFTESKYFLVHYWRQYISALIAIMAGVGFFIADFITSKMSGAQIICGSVFLYIALSLALGAVAVLLITLRRKFLKFAVMMLCMVLSMQIAVNIVYTLSYDDGGLLDFGELFVRIVSGTFQIFTLDADYVTIMTCADNFGCLGVRIFKILFGITTVFAPVTGGFAIIALISQVVPAIKIILHSGKCTKYVFSELNEYSIVAAESIHNRYLLGRKNCSTPEEWEELKSHIIIFTDAYTDRDLENSNELLIRARKIGAICIKTDISELKLWWIFRFGKNRRVVYYLMDRCEESNLKAATMLLSDSNAENGYAENSYAKNWLDSKRRFNRISPLFKCHNIMLYVFTQDAEAGEIIKTAKEALAKRYSNERGKSKLVVYTKIINEYRNLTYQMVSGYINDADESAARLHNYPLYYSLIGVNEQKKLNVGLNYGECDLSKLNIVIIGGGRIGIEFFKTGYWCGQMLKDLNPAQGKLPFIPTQLNITVLSKYAVKTFARLRQDMPEVFKRGELIIEHGSVKYIDDYAYITCEFISISYCPSSVSEELDAGDDPHNAFDDVFDKNCLEADYVLVALGNDDLNLQAAHHIKRKLDAYNLGKLRRIPINYVIENDSLYGSLCKYDISEGEGGCILNPFGSIGSRYSYRNIRMTDLEKRAYVVNQVHDSNNVSFSEFVANEYNLNSSVASALHFPYMLVVCRILKTMYYKDRDSIETSEDFDTFNAIRHNFLNPLYWVEHRRWNAYIRSEGFRCPTLKEYIDLCFTADYTYENEKEKAARKKYKIHPCLVETGAEALRSVKLAKMRTTEVNAAERLIEEVGDDAGGNLGEVLELVDFNRLFFAAREWEEGEEKYVAGADPLDKLSYLTGTCYKDYDIGVIVALVFDELCKKIHNYVTERSRANFDISRYAEALCRLYEEIENNNFEDIGYLKSKESKYFEVDGVIFIDIGANIGRDIILVYNENGEVTKEVIGKLVKNCKVLYADAAVPKSGTFMLKARREDKFAIIGFSSKKQPELGFSFLKHYLNN